MFPRNVPKRTPRMFPECSHEKFYERSIQMLSERSLNISFERSWNVPQEHSENIALERSKNPDIFLVLGTFLERSDGTFRTFHGNVHRTFREGIVLWGIILHSHYTLLLSNLKYTALVKNASTLSILYFK